MNLPRSFSLLALALVLGTVLLAAAPAQAQCQYPTDLMSPVFCYDMMPSGNRACFAQLRTMTATGATMTYWNCMPQFPTTLMSPTDYTNLTYCTYIMGQRRLYGKRPMTGAPTMAFCQVSCDCGVLRIDEMDGLPVELMSFGFDDEEAGGDAGAGDGGADEDSTADRESGSD